MPEALTVLVAMAAVVAVLAAAFAWRARRMGRPPDALTDHMVEVYQVNSAPGEEEMERFMYAQCGEVGCEFLEFADPGAADEEASLRAKVAVHTTKQSPVIQIYV
ncbi:hypothetical protein Rhe02_22450 [Rhizocola hellebori]|uniref:Uncharacterized protein n=1 Tax=Rhizocola hellebori TaxID=1392758 RepID=A0A8J3Q6I5_9ACTN|nr:hypothetical protein [Rhizocola hellebori]GIH04178.1 hypothetical protein Rhe02_22450 [Rhizocola hellebori]